MRTDGVTTDSMREQCLRAFSYCGTARGFFADRRRCELILDGKKQCRSAAVPRCRQVRRLCFKHANFAPCSQYQADVEDRQERPRTSEQPAWASQGVRQSRRHHGASHPTSDHIQRNYLEYLRVGVDRYVAQRPLPWSLRERYTSSFSH
jgi:hypothetical protein